MLIACDCDTYIGPVCTLLYNVSKLTMRSYTNCGLLNSTDKSYCYRGDSYLTLNFHSIQFQIATFSQTVNDIIIIDMIR